MPRLNYFVLVALVQEADLTQDPRVEVQARGLEEHLTRTLSPAEEEVLEPLIQTNSLPAEEPLDHLILIPSTASEITRAQWDLVEDDK